MNIKKMTLDGCIRQFFCALLEQIRNYRDPTGAVPSPQDNDIVHLCLGNAGVGFTFSMDYAERDSMTLGSLLQPNSRELAKLVEIFYIIIQSGQHVVMTNIT